VPLSHATSSGAQRHPPDRVLAVSQPPRAVVAARVERGRLLGLDAARGAAIVAMVIAHGIPFLGPCPGRLPWASNPLLDWLVLNGHYRVLGLVPLFLLGAAIHQWGPGRRTSLLTVVAGVAILVPG
jgi:uncharacterized protein